MVARVDAHRFEVLGIELVELDQQHAAVVAARAVARARRIAQVGAGRVFAVIVGEGAVEDEDFLAERMPVRREVRTRVVADDAGRVAVFGGFARERLAPDARARARLPVHRVGVDHDRLVEIHVQHRRNLVFARRCSLDADHIISLQFPRA